MPNSIPSSVNDCIEQPLNNYLHTIEKGFDAQALSFSGPLFHGVDDVLRNFVEGLANRQDYKKRLVFLLTTEGGYIEVVQRIVETLRNFYDYVAFVVPNYAYSAGTVLVLSGNEIYMDYYSRLGPIDPQVPTADGKLIPALGYLIQWERLLEKSRKGELTVHELMVMLEKFDQAQLYMYEQARELSVTLLKEWLVKYKFANWDYTETRKQPVDDKKRKHRARKIARMLNDTDTWHSHGHGISRKVLEDVVGLKIADLDANPKLCSSIRRYYNLTSDYQSKTGQLGTIHITGNMRHI